MKRGQISTFSVAFLLAVSIIGLALIPIVVLQPNLEQVRFFLGNSLVGILYGAICVLGIAAVFYPAECKKMFQRTQNPVLESRKPSTPVGIKGHHPNCQNFSGNRIRVGRRTFCAACSGLLIGGIIALTGGAFYFFAGLGAALSSIWLLIAGEIMMVLGLAQIKFARYSKMIVNTIFVVGSLVTLIESDLLGKSVIVDGYVLGLIVFLLCVRILISEWNNQRICQTCYSCFQ
jgi:hypothetical protein